MELVLLFGSEKLNILTGAHENLMVKDPHEHLMVMDAHEHLMVTGAHEHLMVMDAHEHFMVTGAHEHHMGIKTDKPITTWNITNNFAKSCLLINELAGHCIKHPEEIAPKLVLWQPAIERRSVGKQPASFIDTLLRDDKTDINELKTAMLDRHDWKKCAEDLPAEARPK